MLAGIDEAGKGCVLGSLHIAIAGVISEEKLKGLGLNDSKKIPKPKRQKLFDKLIKLLDFYEIKEITPQEIDSGNLLQLEASYSKSLIEKFNPTKVFVDCPHPVPYKYKKMVGVPGTEVIAEHKADSRYLTCMAASILAKVSRDNALINLGIKCSGYPGDIHTTKFLENLYPDFPSYVRLSWKTTKKLVARMGESDLV